MDQGYEDVLAIIEISFDLLAESLVLRHVEAIEWLVALEVQEGNRVAGYGGIAVTNLKVTALDERYERIVGGWAQLLQLLLGEDVNGHKVALGVSVLSGLGGGNVNNLARASLDNNVASLTDLSGLHWVGCRGASIPVSLD